MEFNGTTQMFYFSRPQYLNSLLFTFLYNFNTVAPKKHTLLLCSLLQCLFNSYILNLNLEVAS